MEREKEMFEKYCSEIQKLDNFNKEDILTEKFELYNKNNMKIYYTPPGKIKENILMLI